MRRKSIFVNIATIALCLCAIAVGVYSAKTASLNVGGQVGFVAHNCEVEVIGKITGACLSTATNDTAQDLWVSTGSTPATAEEKISLGGTNGESKTATFGNLLFTHNSDANANNIIMAFAITNKSKFHIQASIATTNTTTITGLALETGVTATITNNDAVISANGNATITLTISVAESADEDLAEAVTGGISFNFEKYSPYRLTGQVQKFEDTYNVGSVSTPEGATSTTYAQAFPYYITMGKNPDNNEDLKWLVIGKMGPTSATDSTQKVVALDDEDKAALEAGGLLKDVDYVLLSEKSLEERAPDKEYATSSLRTYLRDTTSTTGFAKNYDFSADEIERITPRNIQNMYMTDSQTFPTGSNSNDTDYFWLLSQTEIEEIFEENSYSFYYLSARTNKLSDTNSSTSWWLRTPHSSKVMPMVRIVDADGSVNDGTVGDMMQDSDLDIGLRPAFII